MSIMTNAENAIAAMREGYEQAKADAVKIIEAKLPHYGEGYERLLIDVRDEINLLSPE